MDYCSKKVKIINLNGWEENSDKNYLEFNNYIGQTGTIKYDTGGECHRFLLKYDDKHMDTVDKLNGKLYFRLENIELLDDTYEHIQKPKPHLEVMPKRIYEFQRVQDLCRALYEYSVCEKVNYELMNEWCEELNDRLFHLKCELE